MYLACVVRRVTPIALPNGATVNRPGALRHITGKVHEGRFHDFQKHILAIYMYNLFDVDH